MTTPDVKAQAVEVLVKHAIGPRPDRDCRCSKTWADETHQVDALAAAGLLADPDTLGRAKAQAWDEGWDAALDADGPCGSPECAICSKDNPYRADAIAPRPAASFEDRYVRGGLTEAEWHTAPAAPGVSVSALLAVRDEITERCLRARHAETFGNHSYRYEATRCNACTETIQSIEAVVATITDDFRRRGCVCGPGKRCARHDLGVTVTDGGEL